jgi:hypothetical protein
MLMLVLMMVLALPSTSDPVLYGGTTQVLLASEYAVVIASDRAQHASNAGRYPHEQQKVMPPLQCRSLSQGIKYAASL